MAVRIWMDVKSRQRADSLHIISRPLLVLDNMSSSSYSVYNLFLLCDQSMMLRETCVNKNTAASMEKAHSTSLAICASRVIYVPSQLHK